MPPLPSPIPDGQGPPESLIQEPGRKPAFPQTMTSALERIDTTLASLNRLAEQLLADPDRHVQRSIQELRAAFASRSAMEPAVARVRRSLTMLRSENHEGSRKEWERRAAGFDRISALVERELLPDLRRIGFEV
jgi:hypothetical protein